MPSLHTPQRAEGLGQLRLQRHRERPGDVVGLKLYEPYEENIAYASAPRLGKSIPELCSATLVPGTVMCPITGDIDLVYIVNKWGGSLSSELMLNVFKDLEEAGFAHTDLVTWVDQQTGSFYFPGKAKQLAGVSVGNEAIVQYCPDPKAPMRATYIDLEESLPFLSESADPNHYLLSIEGTYVPPTP